MANVLAIQNCCHEVALDSVDSSCGSGVPHVPRLVIGSFVRLERGDRREEVRNFHYGALTEEAEGHLFVCDLRQDFRAVSNYPVACFTDKRRAEVS